MAAGFAVSPYSQDIATALVSRSRKPGWRRSTPGPGHTGAVALLLPRNSVVTLAGLGILPCNFVSTLVLRIAPRTARERRGVPSLPAARP